MAVNKVIYGGNTLVDLTGDTVTAADLADGVKATGADGNPIVGLMQKVTIDAELSTTSTNPVQNKVITEAIANMGGGSGNYLPFNWWYSHWWHHSTKFPDWLGRSQLLPVPQIPWRG